MDAYDFDRLVQSLAAPGCRRGMLRLLAALPLLSPLAVLLDDERAAAKRRQRTLRPRRGERREPVQDDRKKKKKKKKKKKRKKKKTSPPPLTPPPPPCVPSACPANACGDRPDGCGGTLSCGGCTGNQICLLSGVCQPCTVTCLSGNPAICGVDLQAALDEGGTVYVCPGRYQGGFNLNDAASIIGAGEGAGVGANTILDANDEGRVLTIDVGQGPVELERLNLTGGSTTSFAGAGILHLGTMLRITECTVTGNTVTDNSGGGIFVGVSNTLEMLRCTVSDNHATGTGNSVDGGGIFTAGIATLTDCLIEDNSAGNTGGGFRLGASATTTLAGTTQVRGNAANEGGGIYVNGSTLVITETCRVTENTALPGNGGGIRNSFGTVTLQGAAPSPIVVNNCHENCVGLAAGICSTDPPVSPCPP